jgi:hypothetical protein
MSALLTIALPAQANELGAVLFGPLRHKMSIVQVEQALDDKIICRPKQISEGYRSCQAQNRYMLAGVLAEHLWLRFNENGLQVVTLIYEDKECYKISVEEYDRWKKCVQSKQPNVRPWISLILRHLEAVTGLKPVTLEPGYWYFYEKSRTIWVAQALEAEFGVTFEPTH